MMLNIYKSNARFFGNNHNYINMHFFEMKERFREYEGLAITSALKIHTIFCQCRVEMVRSIDLVLSTYCKTYLLPEGKTRERWSLACEHTSCVQGWVAQVD